MLRKYRDCLAWASAGDEGSNNFLGVYLLAPPLPSQSMGIIDLAGNVRENLGAQSLRGKILSRKGLVLIGSYQRPKTIFLGFQSERIRVNGKENRNVRHSRFGKACGLDAAGTAIREV